MKRAILALSLVLASLGAASASSPPAKLTFNELAIPHDAQAWLADEIHAAFDKVCAWWGASFEGTLAIDVVAANGPSMALVPAWRGQPGQMQFAGPTVQRRRAATIHEVVHVFAPNANRFLAEGLAVYAHERLGGPHAYPNFGRDLHVAARRYARQGNIAGLDALATPAELGDQGAYLVAGSFVRFLIERSGLDTFRRLYAMTPLVPRQRNAGDPGRWPGVYDASLEQLANDWRNRLTGSR